MTLKWKGLANLLTAVLVLLVGSACGSSPSEPERAEDVTYAASLGIDLTQMVHLTSGVYYQTRIAGAAGRAVSATDRITADYKGYLPDGYMFTSGHFNSQLVPGLIPGLGEGLQGMHNGETRIIVIPSDLGYGAFPPDGSGIPKNTVLIFEIALTSSTA